jgi:hypothetical protein
MLRKWLSVIVTCLCCLSVNAQELNCKVTIMHDKITGTGVAPQVYTAMQRGITEFMNTRRWTTDDFSTAEKIECNILINLTSSNVNGDPGGFGGTLSIQSVRPVYNASYTSTMVNYIDKDFVFKFTEFNPLTFEDNSASGADGFSGNLTATLAYYAYIMLALDYDSFAPNGGTALFKKAQNIVNNAPDFHGASGWTARENNRNRYWLVDQFLNTRFQDVRTYWYTMHREGLDSMSAKPTEARTRILANIRKLYNVNKENPSSILMQFIFNAKSSEFISILGMSPKSERPQYITLLSAIDVANSARYNALR